VSIVSDDTIMPPLQMGEPASLVPALLLVRDQPSAQTDQVTEALPPDVLETDSVVSDVADMTQDQVVLYLVTPLGDGSLHEQEVARWPVENLKEISTLLERLPDDRYRFYHVRRDGQRRLVMDVFLRDGKPLAPGDVQMPESGQQDAGPRTPQETESPSSTDDTSQHGAEQLDESETLRPPTSETAISLRARRAITSGIGLAALLSHGSWKNRVHGFLQHYSADGQLRAAIRRRVR
jgi:hypothetical protein